MKLTELGLHHYKSAQLLNESWSYLSESQQVHVSNWEKNVWPLVAEFNQLMESELTTQQINSIFTNAEKVAVDSGNNTSALGKAGNVTARVSSKIKSEIEKLAVQAQAAGPVTDMDLKFEKIKKQIAIKLQGNPAGQRILTATSKWKSFATEHPAKSAFVLGAMTSVLAFASGGVMSGAAIGFFIKLANNTIKGDTLSTAVGKSAKGAAIGAAAGLIGSLVSDIEIPEPEEEGGLAEFNVNLVDSEQAEQLSTYFNSNEEFSQSIAKDIYQQQLEGQDEQYDADMVNKIANNITISGDVTDGSASATFNGSFVRGSVYLTPDEADEFRKIASNSSMGALSQDATAYINSLSITTESLWNALDVYELQEASNFMAAMGGASSTIGKAVKKSVTAVGKAATQDVKSAGKELGNRVTTKKLLRMWKKSGAPTDTGSIVNILSQAGLDDNEIGTVSDQSDVPLQSGTNNSATTDTPAATTDTPADPVLTALAAEISSTGLAEVIKAALVKKYS